MTEPPAILCAVLLIGLSLAEVTADAAPLCEAENGDLAGGFSPVSLPSEDGTLPLGLDVAYEALAEHLKTNIPTSALAEACPDGKTPALSSLDTDNAEVCSQVVAGTNYMMRLPVQLTCEGGGTLTLTAQVAATVYVPLPGSNEAPQVSDVALEAAPDMPGHDGVGAITAPIDDSGAMRHQASSPFLLVAATLSMAVSTLL